MDAYDVQDSLADFIALWYDVGFVPSFNIKYRRDTEVPGGISTGTFRVRGGESGAVSKKLPPIN